MSPEDFGERLLGQVHEEKLDTVSHVLEIGSLLRSHASTIPSIPSPTQHILILLQLLSDLRHLLEPCPVNVLGCEALDSIFEAVRYPETRPAAVQDQWSSPGPDGDLEGPQDRSHLKPATVHLTSATSAAGKTHLSYYLAAITVLPTNYGGKDASVVWIDTTLSFSAIRLHEITLHYLDHWTIDISPIEKKNIAKRALSAIHVFRPQSSSQLLATLQHLPAYLLNTTNPRTRNRRLALLVVDSFDAFHWPDQFQTELDRLESPHTPAPSRSSAASTTQEISSQLATIQTRFACNVLYTSTSSPPPNHHHLRPSHQSPQTPAVARRAPGLSGAATLTLSLARQHPSAFPPGFPLAQCRQDRANRLAAVKMGRFVGVTVIMERRGSEEWRRVEERLRGLPGQGRLEFSVTGDGVEVAGG